MQANDERREFSRFNVDPIVCRTVPRLPSLCILRDVSVTGAFLQAQEAPPLKSVVEVEFTEEPLSGYRLEAKVVRHSRKNHKGFAVRFIDPRPRVLRAVYHTPSW
jgi:hypothetical protein